MQIILYIKKIIFLIKNEVEGSGITVTNNEIKYIIKVFKYLENRGLLWKRTTKKLKSRRRIFKFSSTVNVSWFTINEKCTHTIS